jgi:hypothetical protein
MKRHDGGHRADNRFNQRVPVSLGLNDGAYEQRDVLRSPPIQQLRKSESGWFVDRRRFEIDKDCFGLSAAACSRWSRSPAVAQGFARPAGASMAGVEAYQGGFMRDCELH